MPTEQKEMFEESRPQGGSVKKVMGLKERIEVQGVALELLFSLMLDTELAPPDRASALAAWAMLKGSRGVQS